MSESAGRPQSPSIVCNLGALTPEQRTRHADLVRELTRELPTAVSELPSGFEFHYRRDPATLAKIVEWIGYESRCCEFFTFDVSVAPSHGPVTLRWTAADPAAKTIIVAAIAAPPSTP